MIKDWSLHITEILIPEMVTSAKPINWPILGGGCRQKPMVNQSALLHRNYA
jgi:hypothetical protein